MSHAERLAVFRMTHVALLSFDAGVEYNHAAGPAVVMSAMSVEEDTSVDTSQHTTPDKLYYELI